MTDNFCERLNDVITDSYSLFNRVEQNMLTKSKRINLSISELHMLEVINKCPIRGKMIGEIASELMITPSSVTIAVNRLEKKGYVVRKKSLEDGRQVYVNLTDKGRHADRIHKRFHKNMARSISDGMTLEEKNILLSCIDRMNIFLTSRLKKEETYRELKKSA
ncbi:MAG TPA: MarR family transcriptional regulator [Clostridiales bacterium]|nr:MarR family transcriptional regulator [Clostridiales bacterium]